MAKSDMTPRAPLDIKLLQERLGYTFQKPDLLMQALTHRSHSKKNNERLEFLGDSVLNCTVAEMLYERYSDLDEGDLSRVRANLVKQQALYELARRSLHVILYSVQRKNTSSIGESGPQIVVGRLPTFLLAPV